MIALAFIAALATGAPAASEQAFQAFRSLCIDTGGDPAASVAAASQAGWTSVPEEALLRLASGADDPKTLQARILRSTEGVMVLAADQSSRPIHEAVLTSNHCQVSFTPGDYPTVLALAKAWAAVPAGQSPDPAKGTVFVFAVDNGRHSVLTKAELENATVRFVRSRRVTTFTVYNLSRGPSLRLDIPVR